MSIRVINYTKRLSLLMRDIVIRVPTLSWIDMNDVLVFARSGRTNADGAFATCHCLSLPAGEPGYYFWRDRVSQRVTRRSEWFVTRSPSVVIDARPIKYMFSFALPRFTDQSLDLSRKAEMYPGADSWIGKLDTVVHELYHLDPELAGIRRIERGDGNCSARCHGREFYRRVAGMVHAYLDSRPSPAVYDFLRDDFTTLESRFGGVVGASFRGFPSFPQRYIERLEEQLPCAADAPGVIVEPLRLPQHPTCYTERDLHTRQFLKTTSRRLLRKAA